MDQDFDPIAGASRPGETALKQTRGVTHDDEQR
jgi:hypothetical protein